MAEYTKSERRRYQLRFEADLAVQAIELQYGRCMSDDRNRFDMDFYLFSLWRLREVARLTRDFVRDDRIRPALTEFENTLPHLERLRDQFTHPVPDDDFLRSLAMFYDAVVQLLPNGQVHYLMQLDKSQPAAEALYRALCDVLGELPNQS